VSKEQLVAAVKKAGVSDDSVARELGKGLESGIMTILTADFYHSSNGDRWQLVRDTDTDRRIVRHEPNISSGGRVTDTPVEEWLDRTGTSPENLALRELLEKLSNTP
jgi:hypothetical protein